jgi:putative phage-type endonuclease
MTADTHSPIVLSGLTREAWLAERAKDITSTEIAAVLGISPYATAFEVWQRKAGKIDDSFADSERARWGRRLEPAIAQGLAEDYGLDARPLGGCYMRHPIVPRMGASFDFEVADRARPELGWGLLEIKNVDAGVFARDWLDLGDGEREAPPHIEAQVQHQLAVSGRRWAAIGVLVGGNRAYLLRRERDEDAIAAICEEVRRFWRSIEEGNCPAPDWRRDLEALRQLYAKTDATATLDDDARARLADLLPRFDAARAAAKAAKEAEDAAKAELLALLGPVERVTIGEWTITAKTITRKAYTVPESTTRRLDVRRRSSNDEPKS